MEDNLTQRYLGVHLLNHPEDLKKMVFVAGPRQVGKTTLLEYVGPKLGFTDIEYLNWDRPKDRPPIRDIQYTMFNERLANATSQPLIIFDELHKYTKWKSYLKGFYDTFRNKLAIFVTGSARLDVYRRGGDSLLGRYWLFHLYPFSLNEIVNCTNPSPPTVLSHTENPAAKDVMDSLLRWGGFPEPFLARSDSLHNRWKRMRRERLIREDLRDLSKIHDLSHVENLMDLVIASVSSSLSLNSLRETLNVSYNAVHTWLKWLEAIYYCFKITPYSKKVTRGLKKEPKYYLYDWSEIKTAGARFENLVAVHLKKSVDFWNDTGVGDFDLRYVRDLEKREVDFLILKDSKVWMLIECKTSEKDIPAPLRHMTEMLKPEFSVLVTQDDQPGSYKIVNDIKYWVSGASEFLLNFI